MEFDDLLAEVEGLLDSPINAAVVEMGHLFARSIGVSAGLDVLPATYRTAFLLMLISLSKMLKKHPEIPTEDANAHAQTAFLALYIAQRTAQREVLPWERDCSGRDGGSSRGA